MHCLPSFVSLVDGRSSSQLHIQNWTSYQSNYKLPLSKISQCRYIYTSETRSAIVLHVCIPVLSNLTVLTTLFPHTIFACMSHVEPALPRCHQTCQNPSSWYSQFPFFSFDTGDSPDQDRPHEQTPDGRKKVKQVDPIYCFQKV